MSLKVSLDILNQKGTPAFYSDTLANRPAFGFAGRVFISTDTGQIFEDTGSAWTLIADATGVVTGFVPYTGATQSVNLGTNNISANAFFNSLNIVTASGTQVVLTINSAPVQLITGSGGQTFKLPDATTLSNGTIFSFNNNQSSGATTVNNNSNTLIASVPSGGYTTVVLLNNSTAAGSWDRHDKTPSNVSWSTNTLDYAGSITSATWNGNVIAINRGGTGSATQNFVDLTTNQSIAGQKSFQADVTISATSDTALTINNATSNRYAVYSINHNAVQAAQFYYDNTNLKVLVQSTRASIPLVLSAGSSSSASTQAVLFPTGNFLLNGFTDAGYKLDVNGTARVQGLLLADAGINLTGSVSYGIANKILLPNNSGSIRAFIATNNGTVDLIRLNSSNQIEIGSGNLSDTILANQGTSAGYSVIVGNTTRVISSIFTINSTTLGFLLPRQTSAQKNAISSPATGLQVYDTDLVKPAVYNGTNWQGIVVPNSNGNVLLNTSTDNGQGTLQNSGTLYTLGLAFGGITFSTNTTAVYTNVFYFFNGGAGITLTLPAVNTKSNYYIIKNYSASPLTLAATGSDTFVAAGTIVTVATLTLASGASTTILGNGTVNWIQIQ